MNNKKKQQFNTRDHIPKVKDKNNSCIYTYKFGNKTVKVTAQKVEVRKNHDPSLSVFYYSCESCKKEFDGNIKTCPDCGKLLTRINLRRCPQCGAKNNPAGLTCLMCGASFPKLQAVAVEGVETVLKIDAGGRVYKSTDESLPPGMKKLFEDLVSSGFRKELLESWVHSHEAVDPYVRESMKDEYKLISQERAHERYIFACIVIFAILAVLLFMSVYLFN